jgi:hypothetical protein
MLITRLELPVTVSPKRRYSCHVMEDLYPIGQCSINTQSHNGLITESSLVLNFVCRYLDTDLDVPYGGTWLCCKSKTVSPFSFTEPTNLKTSSLELQHNELLNATVTTMPSIRPVHPASSAPYTLFSTNVPPPAQALPPSVPPTAMRISQRSHSHSSNYRPPTSTSLHQFPRVTPLVQALVT